MQIVVAAVLAIAAAQPGLLAPAVPLAHSAYLPHVAAPLAYSAPALATPLAYSAHHVAAPLAAPVAVPAPYAINTGVAVNVHAEPVEQHGYQIAY